MTLTVGSLFSGCGGMDEGLIRAGFEVRWQCEIDKWLRELVLDVLHPGMKIYKDVKEIDETAERVDCIVGGSPCQDLSCAGKREGIGGERSGLFFEMLRVVGLLQPRWVIWENVRGAFSSNGGRDFFAVCNAFWRAGYDAEWTTLRASDFGYPHQRARIFLVARLADAASINDWIISRNKFGEDGSLEKPRKSNGRNQESSSGGTSMADSRRQRSQGDCEAGPAAGPVGRSGGTIVADSEHALWRAEHQKHGEAYGRGGFGWSGGIVGDAESGPANEPDSQQGRQSLGAAGAKMDNPPSPRCNQARAGQQGESKSRERLLSDGLREIPRCPPGPADRERWADIIEQWPWLAPALSGSVRSMAPWLPADFDKDRRRWLRALGNSVVCECSEWIGNRIMEYEFRRASSGQ